MKVRGVELKQDPQGRAVLSFVLDAPPSEYSEVVSKIKNGKPYSMELKPIRQGKSLDQVGAIWAKITEIADCLYANKEEIYEECLRRYGQGMAMRIPSEAYGEIAGLFRLVDVKEEREDGTMFIKCYKGLSKMDTAEASRLLEGILDECRQMGLSAEVKSEYT